MKEIINKMSGVVTDNLCENNTHIISESVKSEKYIVRLLIKFKLITNL